MISKKKCIPVKNKNENKKTPPFLFLEVWEPRVRWWKRQSCSLALREVHPVCHRSLVFFFLVVLFLSVPSCGSFGSISTDRGADRPSDGRPFVSCHL